MANKFTRSILLAAVTAGACFPTGVASAQVCFNGQHGSANLGPASSCPTTAEQEIFLVDATNSMTSTGSVGTNHGPVDVTFSSTAALDFANGNGTIKPSATGHLTSFPDLTITTPGHTFTDLLFDVQLVNTTPLSLTLEAMSGGTTAMVSYPVPGFAGLAHDADLRFIVVDPAGLTGVELTSTSGLKEVKQLDISGFSGVSVPEPSTWAMMALGLVGVGLAARRRKGRSRLSDAMA